MGVVRTKIGAAKQANLATAMEKSQGWVWLARFPIVARDGTRIEDRFHHVGLRRGRQCYYLHLWYGSKDAVGLQAATEFDVATERLDENLTKEEAILEAFTLAQLVRAWHDYYRDKAAYFKNLRIKVWRIFGYHRSNKSQGWTFGEWPLEADALHIMDVLQRAHSLQHTHYEVEACTSYAWNVTLDEAKALGYTVLGHAGKEPIAPDRPDPVGD